MEDRMQFAQVLFEADFEQNDRQETIVKFLEETLRLENTTARTSRSSGPNRRRGIGR
jgi:hypothetical protein